MWLFLAVWSSGCNLGLTQDSALEALGGDRDGDGWAPCQAGNSQPCDCDDHDPKVNPDHASKFYVDADGDGYGDGLTESLVTVACLAPAGYVSISGDCDDKDRDAYPGAIDAIVDGYDGNCDGVWDTLSSISAIVSGSTAYSARLCRTASMETRSPIGTTAGMGDGIDVAIELDSTIRHVDSELKYREWGHVDVPGHVRTADINDDLLGRVLARHIETGIGWIGYCSDGDLAPNSTFGHPQGVALDTWGNVYIADTDNNVIRRVSSDGSIKIIAGTGSFGDTGDGGPATDATFWSPQGVAVDISGRVYIADTDNSVIRRISSEGIITTIAGFEHGAGYSGDGGPATSAALWTPSGVAVDERGNVFIADTGNSLIRRISPEGIITTIAGIPGTRGYSGDGGHATAAKLRLPYGVAVDESDDLYIADTNNHVIRLVSSDGLIRTVVGTGIQDYTGDGGPATEATLGGPYGVAVDVSSNVYIADTVNNVIRRVSPEGIISTVVGTGEKGYSGDGGPATDGTLYLPQGVALFSSGALFIADTGNSLIRKVTP